MIIEQENEKARLLYNLIHAICHDEDDLDVVTALSLVVSDILVDQDDPGAAYETFGRVVAHDMDAQIADMTSIGEVIFI